MSVNALAATGLIPLIHRILTFQRLLEIGNKATHSLCHAEKIDNRHLEFLMKRFHYRFIRGSASICNNNQR